MKQYTYEELCAFVKQQLEEGSGVLCCRPRSSNSTAVHPFIRLDEAICYEPHWRGGPLTFEKGDYLHANPRDVYGLTAETFSRCYIIMND